MILKHSKTLVLTILFMMGFLFPVCATEPVPITYYRLDTGIIFTWGTGSKWDNGAPDKVYTRGTTTLEIAGLDKTTIKVLDVYPYAISATGESNFNFVDQNVAQEGLERYEWSQTLLIPNRSAYRDTYYNRASSDIRLTAPFAYDENTGKLALRWSALLKSNKRKTGEAIKPDVKYTDPLYGDFNAKELILQEGIAGLAREMGYTEADLPEGVRIPAQALLDNAKNSTLHGYAYYVPLIVKYQIDPELPLKKPIVTLDCKAESVFIGLPTPLKGSVKNVNTDDVITYYSFSVDGKPIQRKDGSGWMLQKAGETSKVATEYTVPDETRPGTTITFKLEAKQTWAAYAPDQYLPRNEGEPRVENPTYTAFVNTHTFVRDANAWYKNDAEWVSAHKICKKGAVLQPEAPLDHSLSPAVIVN